MKACCFSLVVLCAAGAAGTAGCQRSDSTPTESSQGIAAPQRVPSRGEDWSILLRWGSGPGQAGYRAAEPERLGEGVSAVGMTPGDGVLLLDRLNRRVVWASGKGARPVATIPKDAEDLVVGPDGSFAVHSLLRARVWVYQGATLVGELGVDRNLRELVGLSLSASREVFVHNAFQETYSLGSPAAPRSLGSSLHRKREGAFVLRDGTGVSVRRTSEGHPEILLLVGGERSRVIARHRLPEKVLAARVIGVVGAVACLKLEQARTSTPLVVERKAVCHELSAGARLLERSLGTPGLYLPRRELAVGETPPRLTFIHPQTKGLRVDSWRIPDGKGEAR